MVARSLATAVNAMAELPLKRRWLPLRGSSAAAPSTSAAPSAGSSVDITIVSYNLLAQSLIRRSWFPYASTEALRVKHRSATLTAELLSLQASVISLQEVDADWYSSHLRAALGASGYTGHFACKQHKAGRGPARHGCAIFYREEEMQQVDYQELQLDDAADEFADDPLVTDEIAKGNVAQLLTLAVRRPAAAPTSAEPPPQPECGLMISNTHLHWNPLYRFTRLLQCRHILAAVARTASRLAPARFHQLFMGDLNLTPTAPVYRWLTEGELDDALYYKFATPSEMLEAETQIAGGDGGGDTDGAGAGDVAAAQLKANGAVVVKEPAGSRPQDELRDDGEEAAVLKDERYERRMAQLHRLGLERAQYARLGSVYSAYTRIVPDDIAESVAASARQPYCDWTGYPPFTHYVQRWQGTVDHILMQKQREEADGAGSAAAEHNDSEWTDRQQWSTLEAVSVLELPTEEVVTAHTALPNETLASDHLAIGCQFRLHMQPRE
jgi:mRNA deadenylase 3'-5' endonuclease subunit Ccr4